MKKLNSLVVLAAATLSLGALVACGPTQSTTETPSETPTESTTEVPSETSEDLPPVESETSEDTSEEEQEELIEMPTLKEGSVMTGEFIGFGNGTVDVYLKENNKVFFDVTCYETMPNVPQEVMNTMFDREGTYEVSNNVYTFTVVWEQKDRETGEVVSSVTKTYISVYNTRSDVDVLDYVLVGQKELPAKLVGRLPRVNNTGVVAMEGEFVGFGNGLIQLTLNDDGSCLFDATCYETMPNVPQEVMNKMFDKVGTWEVHGNEYTFTVVWEQKDRETGEVVSSVTKTYISVWNEEKEQHELDYVLVGQKELPAHLVGKLCK